MTAVASRQSTDWKPRERDALTEQILATLEAKAALAQTPSQEQLQELCETDAELRKQMVERSLSPEQVARELFRQEWLRNTLALVADRVVPATQEEARRYYEARATEWVVPETRLLAHILVTVQEESVENSEAQARRRIESLGAQLKEGQSFGQLARRWSECPTALEDGVLGWVPPGRLYPSLDAAAFRLGEGECTEPLRTELGFHIVQCREIRPEHVESFEALEPKLLEALTKQRRVHAQKKWVAAVAQEARDVS